MADNELLIKLKAIDNITPVMLSALVNLESTSNKMTAALDKLSEGTKRPGDGAKEAADKFGALGSIVTGVNSAIEIASGVWEKLSGQYEKAIAEAEETEKVQNMLTGALVSSGNYTEALTQKIEKYADALENAKGISGEQTRTLIAQSVQMGLSVDKALELEQASRKLAVATGTDASSAFNMLRMSLLGQTRGLAQVLPQVKDLTAAQLKAGDAARIVNEALGAQYNLYEQSYSAAVAKAENAVSNVYEALGKIVTQNPAVIAGIQAFAESMKDVEAAVTSAAQWIKTNGDEIAIFGQALLNVGKIAAVGLGIWAVAALAAADATVVLTVAAAALWSPVTLVTVAVVGLTAAFTKWPGLFDQIVGGAKVMFSYLIDGFELLVGGAAKVVGFFNKDLSDSLLKIHTDLDAYADKWKKAGEAQIDAGLATNEAVAATRAAKVAVAEETTALDANLVATSAAAKAKLALIQSYAGIAIGTKAQREALTGESEGRDQDLKKFNDYLTDKMRMAVSKAEEQKQQLAKVQAATLTSGGVEDKTADASAAIAEEQKKQAGLRAAKALGVINEEQLAEELLASRTRIQQQELTIAQVHQQALADALGESPGAFQVKLGIKRGQYEQELQLRLAAAQREGATAEQLTQLKAQADMKFNADSLAQKQAQADLEFQMETANKQRLADALGESPAGYQLKLQIEDQRFQEKLARDLEQAGIEGATLEQINQTKQQAELNHLAQSQQQQQQYWTSIVAMREQTGNFQLAYEARYNANLVTMSAGAANALAIVDDKRFEATKTGLDGLSALTRTKSKELFAIGKAASLASAVLNTAEAITKSLASLPFPFSAIAAAGAAAAGAVQIATIKGQKFDGGGQADEGMESVPQSLSGKSFILSAGERVVQPEANAQLTDFLDKQKNAPAAGAGTNVNVTMNYSGTASSQDARRLAEDIAKELRAMSDRGQIIISSKGVGP